MKYYVERFKQMFEEKIVYASAKPTEQLLGLFQKAQALEPSGLSYSEVFERAEHYFIENHSLFDTNLLDLRKSSIKYNGNLPSSFKVRINNIDLDQRVNEILERKYSITRVMTPFKMKIVLFSYILNLEGKIQNRSVSNGGPDLNSLKLESLNMLLQISDIDTLRAIHSFIKETQSKRIRK